MAITKVSSPKEYGRVWDTNRLTFTFTSTNWQQPNFNFYIEAKRYDIVNSVWISVGTFYMFPLNGGTMNFNPSIVFRNYLTSDIDITLAAAEEAINSSTSFRLDIYEYYSDTTNNGWPYKHAAGSSLNNDIILFNGAQAAVAYDDITVGPGNGQWIVSGTSTGRFLTDAGQYRMDNDDRGFVYWLSPTNLRPTRVRYIFYYWYAGGALPDLFNVGNNYLDYQSMPNPYDHFNLVQIGGGSTPAGYTAGIRSGVTYLDITYAYGGSIMHYVPVGPKNIAEMSLFDANFTANNWLYYVVDLMSGSTVLTKTPMLINRQNNKCDKYGRWQMFWLNPHGGYDTFTFTQKNTITDKIKRTTFKQRLLPTQTTSAYQAGERIFNTQVTEETVLRSASITQQEMQLLMQMARAPIVYAMKIYDNNGTKTPYLAPYIITTEEVIYSQKIQDKEIYFEIKVRPSNEGVVQMG